MFEDNLFTPHDIYAEHLTSINNIKLSNREVDVIACIINGRSAKGIAEILPIVPKAVEKYILNARKKLNCNSRDQLLSLIENSGKLHVLKNYYLHMLVYYKNFNDTMQEISKSIDDRFAVCHIIYGANEDALFHSQLKEIKFHLKTVGIKLIIEKHQEGLWILPFIQRKSSSGCIIIYAGSNKTLESLTAEETGINITYDVRSLDASSKIFLFLGKKTTVFIPLKLYDAECLDLTKPGKYYSGIFAILKKILPQNDLDIFITAFKKKYLSTINTFYREEQVKSYSIPIKIYSRQRKLIILLIFLTILVSILIRFTTHRHFKKSSEVKLNICSKKSIRSGLVIPSENHLLKRFNILDQINKFLSKQKHIKTVALIGIGGSGKTVIARHYAQQQATSIIWEINAETIETVKNSFKELAETLAETENNQNKLKEIQQIKDLDERNKKTIFFVRDYLKSCPNWLLIYDNVEKFTDIQKYFPQDPEAWGLGQIIITTQDANIQNNKYINYIIQIKELNLQEKFDFFNKITNSKEEYSYTAEQNNKIKEFLKEIPPFPLDVSLAAYYLKSTGISYKEYLENLAHSNKDFMDIHKNILEESGDYKKLRYGIINLSLKQIINEHPDFESFLIFVGFLDSQNIPKELLTQYKEQVVVDKFIYHLKKYSLIIDEENSYSNSNPTFSVHRSTQSIILNYFIKKIHSKSNLKFFQNTIYEFEKFVAKTVDKQKLITIKILMNHVITFLKHEVIPTSVRRNLQFELGRINFYLIRHKESTDIFKEILKNLKQPFSSEENLIFFKSLLYLGIVNRELGDYYEAKNLLEESVIFYRKNSLSDLNKISLALQYLGIAYRECGDYLKAKDLMMESLNFYRKYFPKDQVNIAQTLTYLGSVDNELGNYKNSENFLEESITIYKNFLPEHYFGTARASAHLGNCYINLNELAKAKELLEDSLKLYRKFYADNKVGIAWVLLRLGKIEVMLFNYEKAKSLLEESNTLYREIYGPEHIEIARTLVELSKLHLQMNNINKAENNAHSALRIFQRNKHLLSYTALEALADLYLTKNTLCINNRNLSYSKYLEKQAISCLEQALNILTAHFSQDCTHVIRIRSKIKKLQ